MAKRGLIGAASGGRAPGRRRGGAVGTGRGRRMGHVITCYSGSQGHLPARAERPVSGAGGPCNTMLSGDPTDARPSLPMTSRAPTRVERRRAWSPDDPCDVVCLSLEPWDEVWRRNQHMATQMLRLRPPCACCSWAIRSTSPGPCARSPSRTVAAAPGRRLGPAVGHDPAQVAAPAASGPGGTILLGPGGAGRAAAGHRPSGAVDQRQHVRPPRSPGRAGPASTTSPTTGSWPRGAPGSGSASSERLPAAPPSLRGGGVLARPGREPRPGPARPTHRQRGRRREPAGPDANGRLDLPAGRIALYQGTLSAGRLDIELCLNLARALRRPGHPGLRRARTACRRG